MYQVSSQATSGKGPRRSTLSGRLLLAVNSALAVILGLFLIWQYHSEWKTHIREMRASLQAEAMTLLPTVRLLRRQGPESVQSYIDEVCGSMRETIFPGHHVAVIMGDELYQALVHGRASLDMVAAMEEAGLKGGLAPVGGRAIVVGEARADDTVVYVSEYLANIRDILRWLVIRSILGIVVAGVALALVVNVLLHRLLIRPLGDVVEAVRRIKGGDLGARLPEVGTAELGVLADEFNRMAGELERSEADRHARMERARRIQSNLLPELGRVPGVEVSCLYEPAEDLAGDYYDVMSCPDGSLLLCVADVTGHGVPAAMGAGMLKTLLQSAVEGEHGPAELLQCLNRAYTRVTLPEDFATVILVRYEPSEQLITYASAGHETSYLLCAGGRIERLESTGFLLGIDATAEWPARQLPARPGDCLVLLTDGLTEACSPGGEPFGSGRLLEVLRGTRGAPPGAICEEMIEQVTAFRGATLQRDDMTMLVIELGPPGG